MHTSILKLVYTHNEPLHASANHVAICRNIKYKVKHLIYYILWKYLTFVFYIPEGGHIIGWNM